MPHDGVDICDECGLEFDEGELNAAGLCPGCRAEYEEEEEFEDDYEEEQGDGQDAA